VLLGLAGVGQIDLRWFFVPLGGPPQLLRNGEQRLLAFVCCSELGGFEQSFPEVKQSVLIRLGLAVQRLDVAYLLVDVELALGQQSGDGALAAGFLVGLDDVLQLLCRVGDEAGGVGASMPHFALLQTYCHYI